jgi:hypothetical protein
MTWEPPEPTFTIEPRGSGCTPGQCAPHETETWGWSAAKRPPIFLGQSRLEGLVAVAREALPSPRTRLPGPSEHAARL